MDTVYHHYTTLRQARLLKVIEKLIIHNCVEKKISEEQMEIVTEEND